ncbi:hypothetical protein AB0J35_25985 [Nonomuraea angiospora]|uniref:hypothetical protein n=1 Tax=Nonomuraea angiospora TaxID=46172 RepID=UPI0034153BC4
MTASGDELRAAYQARKDLGPEYEDALIQSFLEKMDQEVDRRVEDRLARQRQVGEVQSVAGSGQRLALAIVSVTLGILGSVAALAAEARGAVLAIWIGISVVNVAFALGNKQRGPSTRSPGATGT